MAITHIAHMNHVRFRSEGKTLCGLVVYGGRKVGATKKYRTQEGDRVLDYYDWIVDSEETCVGCEAALPANGLEPRG